MSFNQKIKKALQLQTLLTLISLAELTQLQAMLSKKMIEFIFKKIITKKSIKEYIF